MADSCTAHEPVEATSGRASGFGPAVSVHGVAKTFAGTRALKDVDLEFRPGEIHALCGGNGSGKSTLIKILCGVYHADDGGRITVGATEIPADRMTPALAHQHGIRVVHQDLAVFPELTVAENLAITSGFRVGAASRIQWNRLRAQAQEALEAFGIPATPDMPLMRLSLAARTQVAIARALRMSDRVGADGGGLLILDEPTAALPVHEVRTLLRSLRQIAGRGQGILYVSHRLDEVLDLSDRVSVLRDGELVGTFQSADLDEPKLVDLMLGRAVHRDFERHGTAPATSPVVLEARNLSVGAVTDVSLAVRSGEVVGLAGLMGSGRSSLLRAIFGDLTPRSGDLLLAGEKVRFRHPKDAINSGVVMVPEHRVADAVFLDQPVDMNLAMSVMRSYWRRGRIVNAAMRADGNSLIQEFGVKAPDGRVLMSSLSGGNQQKVVMARWMRREPRVLLLDEPTQGVDVGARADMYRLIRRQTARGTAALVVASDLEELAAVVDRALVLRHGRIVAELSGSDLTAHRLAEQSYADDH